MRPVVVECPICKVEVRGKFRQAVFQMLSSDDQEFLEKYLLAEFSIKALAEESGMGYTAIRSRLDRLIHNYRSLCEGEVERKLVLEKVASGEISAAEAAEMIAKGRSEHD